MGESSVEDRLTDCVLGTNGGYRPGPLVAAATPSPLTSLRGLRSCGVEFAFGREIIAPWGEGYQGTEP